MSYGISPARRRSLPAAAPPGGRLGTGEDISACALYLASPAADYVTGEIYGVNGGLTTLNFEMPRADL